MKKILILALAMGFMVSVYMAPAFAGWDVGEAEVLKRKAEATIAQFKHKDPGMKRFFDNAHGYAVFPRVGKGAILVGAAEGTGLVYEKGTIVGKATLSQVTVGFQAGGQVYSQIIFFQDKIALDNLKNNQMKFSGTASAVAATAGASAAVDYEGGVAVFTLGEGGLMLEVSMGGQQFKYEPKPE